MRMNKNKALLSMLAVFALSACDSKPSDPSTPKVDTPKAYQPSAQEKSVLKVMFMDEVVTSADQGDVLEGNTLTPIIGDFVATNSNAVQKEYERNEVAGDQKFRNKTILVSSTVKSIDRSVGESYFIGMNGGSNPYINPKAQMADGYTEFLGNLNKGQKIFLACKGNGMLMGSAMFNKCEPVVPYAKSKVDSYVEKMNIGQIVETDTQQRMVLIYSVAIASQLPADSPCFAPDYYSKACLNQVDTVTKKLTAANKKKDNSIVEAAIQKIGIKTAPATPTKT